MTKRPAAKKAEKLQDLVLDARALDLDASGEPPKRIRIAQFGENPTTKGVFVLTKDDAKAMVERAQKRGIKQHADYEHASLHAAAKGTEAPAACWYDLELGQDGLYAGNIEWTKPALGRLKEREYRYMSPWFGQREDGTVASFKNFALTNRPAMDNLAPLVATEDDASDDEAPPPEKPKMKTLFKNLALSEDATEADVIVAVQAITKERDAFFTATGTKDLPSALAAVAAAKQGAEKAEQLQKELAEVKGGQEKKEHELLLNEAVTAGQIEPNMKDFWASMPIDKLKAYVAKAPKKTTAGSDSKVKEKGTDEIDLALSDVEKATAKSLNITEAEFLKHKKEMAGRAV